MTLITTNTQNNHPISTPEFIPTNEFQDFNKLDNTQLFDALSDISLSYTHEYTDIAYAPLMHVLTSREFNTSEKLSYILSDLYGAKTISYNSSGDRSVKFTAKKLSEVIGCSERNALRVEQKLEQLGYFKIKRSKNHKYRNNVNVITPTIPDKIFCKLLKQNIRNDVNLSDFNLSDIDLSKLGVITETG